MDYKEFIEYYVALTCLVLMLFFVELGEMWWYSVTTSFPD